MAMTGLKLTVMVGKKRKTFPSVEAAAAAFKIPYGVLYQRLFKMEWNATKAVTTPVRKHKKAKKAKVKAKKRK